MLVIANGTNLVRASLYTLALAARVRAPLVVVSGPFVIIGPVQPLYQPTLTVELRWSP